MRWEVRGEILGIGQAKNFISYVLETFVAFMLSIHSKKQHTGHLGSSTVGTPVIPCRGLGVVPTKKNPTLYHRTPHFVPQNSPADTKKTPTMYQKTPFGPKKHPFAQKKTPFDVARMDPHKSNMHQQKHPFYQKKKTAVFPMYATLVDRCVPKTNLVAPFHTKKPQDGLPQGFLLSTTFYNSHTPPAPKQNTERTLTFSSMTFHSLSYLHA